MSVFLKTLLFSLCLLGLAGSALAAPTRIAPHRAVYQMSLASVKNGSQIRAVSGKIEYEWADGCEAWVTQQHMTLRFTDIDGQDKEVVSHVLATEAKDGKTYRFNIRRFIDGSEDEAYKGEAQLGMGGGRALYALPKKWGEKNLPEGAMFPTSHTLLIIEKALAGEKMFTRPVFDGSDEAGVAEVSAFIAAPSDKRAQSAALPAALRGLPIMAGEAWPVRLAFYVPGDAGALPDYEMDMVLQPNGVARSLQIDYGDFVVGGKLETITPLKEAACAARK